MVQRIGSQSGSQVLFIQNNFYYDAFFLKAIGAFSFLLEWMLSHVSCGNCLSFKWRMQRWLVLLFQRI